MSDVMLIGVLRMPPDCWSGDPIDVAQRHSRYVQAADTIDSLHSELSRLRELVKEMRVVLGNVREIYGIDSNHLDRLLAKADAALSTRTEVKP